MTSIARYIEPLPLLCLTSLLLFSAITASWMSQAWWLLTVAGSMSALVGLVMSGRKIIRLGPTGLFEQATPDFDGGSWGVDPEKEKEEERLATEKDRQLKKDIQCKVYGFPLAFIGLIFSIIGAILSIGPGSGLSL